MELTVEIVAAGDDQPPAGVPVIVEIRDAAYQDATAPTVAGTRTASTGGEVVARATVSCDARRGAIVWVHVDVDGDGRVSTGDFITMQSYPVRDGGAMRVEVKRV